MSQEPTIGRIVHYVLDEYQDEYRPAIIVHVGGRSTVNLQVFTDGQNDSSDSGTMWKSYVEHDEEFKEQGTWHWPERTS